MVSPLNHKLKLAALAVIVLAGALSLEARGPIFAYASGEIRVAIVQGAKSLNVKISGSYRISGPEKRKLLREGRGLNTVAVADKQGIALGGWTFGEDKLSIEATEPKGVIFINGRPFRGDIRLIRKDDDSLLAVNHISLQDYIRGILYHEVSHYWPVEALKAQAVVCRSYALYQMKENAQRDFDVTSDTYSQVYGGMDSERYRTDKAVLKTQGHVLTYGGEILPAYYHATCAGHTQDASLLWNVKMPPLSGVACNFCQDSPHFKWRKVLSAGQTQEALTSSGQADLKEIKGISAAGRDNSGRVSDLKILTDKGEVTVSAKNFRAAVGPNAIKSTNFTVEMQGDDLVFEGKGWGHGAGLCQWGAYFMAKRGYNYEQILKYYYPGAEISFDY